MRLSLPQLLSTTCLSALVATGVLPLADASAATKTWNSTSSTDWLTAGNWSASGVPVAADTVVIDLGAYGPDVVTTGPTATNIFVGNGGTGTLSISNGGTVSDTIGYLGNGGGSSGTATVTGAGSSWANSGDFRVGNSGNGVLSVQNGGQISNTQGYIAVGSATSGTATVTGTGSIWTSSSFLAVGYGGTGALTINSGGSVNAAGSSIIGNLAGSTGTATVTGSGSTWTGGGTMTVGNNGTGSLTISSGGTVSNTSGTIGNVANSVGTATVTGIGSSWANSGDLRVGNSGTAALTISDGGTISNTSGYIGLSVGSIGTATVTGSGSSWTNSSYLYVGNSGTGTLNVQNSGGVTLAGTGNLIVGAVAAGGTLNISSGGVVNNTGGASFIGYYTGSNGTATISGSGSKLVSAGDVYVRLFGSGSGSGVLTVSDGGEVTAGSGTTYSAPFFCTSGCVSTSTVYVAYSAGTVASLNIGGDVGHGADAAGTVNAATVAFGSGTGELNFNHTSSNYTFAPAITGAGTIRNLAGTTNLTGDLSGFTGSTQLTGGTLSYDYGGSSSISTALSGTGGFVVASGGTTTLTGNSSAFAGTTTVEDGSTLSLNGALGGALSVNSGGTLKGSGTAATVAAGTGGSIAPGNSIGTLTVTDISFAPGSVYEAEIDANGNHDLIHATGTATLTGGQVAVSYAPGTYLPGMSYTLLTADGGITGTFDSQTDTLGTLFMEAGLSYDTNHVTLNLIQFRDFSAIAATQNQIAAANAAQALATGNPVYNNLVVMQDASAARAAFDSLSGEVHASTQAALIGSAQPVNDLLLGRLETISQATDRTPPFQVAAATNTLRGMVPQRRYEGAWVQGFGSWGQFDGNANAATTHARNSGVLMGLDGALNDDWQGGAAAGYSVTDINDRGRSSSALARNYHAAAYAGMKPSANQPVLRLGGGFTWHDVESTRGVGFGGFSDSNSADYDAWTAQAFADLSQPFTVGKGGSLSPFGTLAYLHQSTNAFTESGGPSALHVDGSATDLATTTLGLRGSQRLSFPKGDIKQAALSGSMGWRHLIGDETPASAAQFASGGSGFAVEGTPIARDAFVYDAALSLRLDANASLDLRYGGQLAPEAQQQSLSGQFRYAF